MNDGPENLVLRYLRRIDGNMAKLSDNMREVKERLGFLKAGYASLSRRVDRTGDDVERIKRRLDIVDAPAN